MELPYRARVDERWFLDLPSVGNSGAYVFADVEDTSECDLRADPSCDETCSCCPDNFEPRVLFELGTRRDRFGLGCGTRSRGAGSRSTRSTRCSPPSRRCGWRWSRRARSTTGGSACSRTSGAAGSERARTSPLDSARAESRPGTGRR